MKRGKQSKYKTKRQIEMWWSIDAAHTHTHRYNSNTFRFIWWCLLQHCSLSLTLFWCVCVILWSCSVQDKWRLNSIKIVITKIYDYAQRKHKFFKRKTENRRIVISVCVCLGPHTADTLYSVAECKLKSLNYNQNHTEHTLHAVVHFSWVHSLLMCTPHTNDAIDLLFVFPHTHQFHFNRRVLYMFLLIFGLLCDFQSTSIFT